MFEIVIVSGSNLQSFKVMTLKEALKIRFVYLSMGLPTRIWPA